MFVIAWIPFIHSLLMKKKWILQQEHAAISYLSHFKIHIVVGIIMAIAVYIVLTLYPAEQTPFANFTDKQIEQALNEDEILLAYLDDRLELNFKEADTYKIFEIDFTNITNSQKAKLTKFWNTHTEVLLELDLIKERYKTSYQLNKPSQKELRNKAFINGFSALLAQHHYNLKLTKHITNKDIVTFFNEQRANIPAKTYDRLESLLTDTDELLRLSTGRLYYSFLDDTQTTLRDQISQHLDTISGSLGKYASLVAKKPLNFIEKSSVKLWFPIQKRFTHDISFVRATNRNYHITPEIIGEHADKLLPGDIFLQRREWHATNVGIPGFWTHSALHIGKLSQLDEYFAEIPALKETTFSAYIEKKFPEAYAQWSTKNDDGFFPAVIESKRPGVIMLSLEESARADGMVALRPKNLTKNDQFKIITQALPHLGKPYDYDFNFVTDNEFVCSELIYKSYTDISQLNLKLHDFNGRPIITPNEIAQKFAHEYETPQAELDLIFFLDGNEKQKTVNEKSAEEFLTTWQRPKWHAVSDF